MRTRTSYTGNPHVAALCRCLLLCTALFVCAEASAVTVTRALVTGLGGKVELFNVDENGIWTKQRDICSSSGAGTVKRTIRAFCHDNVVYVGDMIADSSETGYIRMFTLDGTYLGDLTAFDFRLDGMCLSSDKQSIWCSSTFGTSSGRLFRYSLADMTWTTVRTGLGQIRQVAVDGNGHLAVGARGGTFCIIDEATGNTLFSQQSAKVQAVCWDPLEQVFWLSCFVTKYGSCGPDGTGWNLNDYSISGDPKSFGIGMVNGMLHLAMYDDKKIYRRNADGTLTAVATASGGSGVSDVSEVPVNPVATWNFDESANAAAFTNSLFAANHAILPMGMLQSGASGVSGGCAYFGGTAARGELADSRDLIPRTNDFTVMFWAGMPSVADVGGSPEERYLFSNAGGSGELTIMANLDGASDKLGCFVHSGETVLRLTSTSDFANGAWHHVALVRRGGATMELWLDGACEASVECPASMEIGQALNWHVGSNWKQDNGFVPPGTVMDDLSIYDLAVSSNRLAAFRTVVTPAILPARPALPSGAQAMPAEFGTEISHAYACDAAIGSPAIHVAEDGTYYLASSRGGRGGAADQSTTIWKSTDRGATWTLVGTLAVGNGVLFESGGMLCCIGHKLSCNTVSVNVSEDGGATWTESITSTSEGAHWELSSAPVLVSGGRIWQAVTGMESGIRYPSVGYVTFAVDGATFSNGRWARSLVKDFAVADYRYTAYETLYSTLPGVAGTLSNGNVRLLFPTDSRRPKALDGFVGTETCYSIRVAPAAPTSITRETNVGLPGGAKQFSVRWDAQSQLFWALTVAVTNHAALAGRNATDIRDVLALYASPDLQEWRPCGVVATASRGTFDKPTFAFDGDDLAVAYAVSCDDGAGGSRSPQDGNYLAFRKVAGFRTAFAPATPSQRQLLVCDMGMRALLKYYRGADGQWYSGGTFASGSVGGYTFNVVDAVAARGRVYAVHEVNSGSGHVFVFKNDGTLVKTITAPANVRTDALAISKDGKRLLVADPFGSNAIYALDPFAETWTKLCEYTGDSNGGVNGPRGIFLMSDGTFYALGRSGGGIRHYASDGTFLEQVVSTVPGSPIALWVDEVNGTMYYAETSGKTYACDLSTKISTVISSRNITISTKPASNMQEIDGRLYLVGTLGFIHAVDTTGGTDEEVPFPQLYFPLRMTMVDFDSTSGMVLLFK